MAEREPPTKVKRVNMTPASAEETKLKFRNYTPRDPELKKFILKKDSSEDSLLIKKQYLDRFVTLSTGSSTQTLTLAPKKPNWDLKRDVARRLEKLEKRTQRAILELAQEKQQKTAAVGGPGGAESVD